MAKQLLYDARAREKLTAGMSTLSEAVRSTLGPTGKNVILEKNFSSPVSTKDGVTVSKEIELPDPFENMGAKLLNEVASRTNDKVGDGTTTAVVLAQAMIAEGQKYLAGGVHPNDLRRGMEKALKKVIGTVRELSTPVQSFKDIRNVAYISSNSDEAIADMLAEAMEKVGKDGVITIEESSGIETRLELVQGLQFDKGYISPYFVTDPKTMTAEYEDPYILFFEKKLSSLQETIPLLEKVSTTGKPLIICAEDVEGEVLTGLVINKLQGVLKVAAVKSPGFGDRRKNLLEDMAILTGGVAITEDLGIGLDQIQLEHLGQAKKVVIEKEKTTIVEGAGEKKNVQARIDQINAQIDQTPSTYDQEKFMERKAKLSEGIGVIYIGGHTEIEMKERKDRATDALHATRAAGEEGVVAGAGTSLLRAYSELENVRTRGEEEFGVRVVKAALEQPLRRLSENGGLDGGEVVEEVYEREGNVGFDAIRGKYVDLVKAGIIDPAKVVITSLQNAVSAASLNLTADVLITDVEKKHDPVSGSVS